VLRHALLSVSFDDHKDRLISVGDLVDRGPKSEEVLGWLDQSWFHAVRGNHEQMAIEYVEGMTNQSCYVSNGGQWFIDLPQEKQCRIAETLARLPYLIEIDISTPEDPHGLVGVVHADPVTDDWDLLKAGIDRNVVQIAALWSRARIKSRAPIAVRNVSAVVCGHTIISEPIVLGNVFFIDTGAVAGGALTLLEHRDGQFITHVVKTNARKRAA
jgi:serine/threonine protein phosphatase 1